MRQSAVWKAFFFFHLCILYKFRSHFYISTSPRFPVFSFHSGCNIKSLVDVPYLYIFSKWFGLMLFCWSLCRSRNFRVKTNSVSVCCCGVYCCCVRAACYVVFGVACFDSVCLCVCVWWYWREQCLTSLGCALPSHGIIYPRNLSAPLHSQIRGATAVNFNLNPKSSLLYRELLPSEGSVRTMVSSLWQTWQRQAVPLMQTLGAYRVAIPFSQNKN